MKLLFVIVLFGAGHLYAQPSDVNMFIFGNSLVHHEFQVNETISDETSVPHWLHFLSEAAGKEYQVAGQYGFLPQHANLPPFSQWGFDFVAPAWDSDNESFAEADFSHILITPGNFIQWQGPAENYPNENLSPVSATNSIVEWCAGQEQALNFYIYEGWPDMAAYLSNGFPPNDNEWSNYNDFLQTEYAEWFDEYHRMVEEANTQECVNMIPVARLISRLLGQSPYDEIAIDQLYEDDAPHGRASIYFLASMISYMAVFEEEVPSDFGANDFIDPIILENYEAIASFFWSELLLFNDEDNNSKVFCDINVAVADEPLPTSGFALFPNPFDQYLYVQQMHEEVMLQVYDCSGKIVKTKSLGREESRLDMSGFADGLYWVKIITVNGGASDFKRLVKMSK